MKKWPFFLLSALEALTVLAAVYFEPSYCVRGKMHGEAFFAGKPTSWWRGELEQWEVSDIWADFGNTQKEPVPLALYQRNPAWFDRFKDGGWQFWKDQPKAPVLNLGGEGPTILQGQPEAAPVLRELLDDPSPKVRRFARGGLNLATGETEATP